MTEIARIPIPRRDPTRPSENKLSMRAEHRGALQNIATEAAGIAGAAAKIVQIVHQALSEGGTVSLQAQNAYIAGAFLRMTKDLGVVEHLQKHGAQQRRGPRS